MFNLFSHPFFLIQIYLGCLTYIYGSNFLLSFYVCHDELKPLSACVRLLFFHEIIYPICWSLKGIYFLLLFWKMPFAKIWGVSLFSFLSMLLLSSTYPSLNPILYWEILPTIAGWYPNQPLEHCAAGSDSQGQTFSHLSDARTYGVTGCSYGSGFPSLLQPLLSEWHIIQRRL